MPESDKTVEQLFGIFDTELVGLDRLSLLLTVTASCGASFLILELFGGLPLVCSPLARSAEALSMSGNLPLVFFAGFWLPSFEYKNFSFWRSTLETVLK
jgi:hypothetical protein